MIQAQISNGALYSFGRFRLNVNRRELFDGLRVQTLAENVQRVLLLLLEANGEVVPRETFFLQIWPDDPVGDANLTQHIYLIRKVLAAAGDGERYVVTVPRRGYRLGVPVRALHAPSETAGIAIGDSGELDAYCSANFHLEKQGCENLVYSVEAFKRILTVNPLCAPAHLGVARAQTLLGRHMFVRPKHAFAEARKSALRSLELEPSAAAYAALAEIALFGFWDARAAGAHLQSAYAFGHHPAHMRFMTASVWLGLGDSERAVHEIGTALEHNPSSHELLTALGRIYVHRQEYGRAIDILSGVLRREPPATVARAQCALAYLCTGDMRRALVALTSHIGRESVYEYALLAHAYNGIGDGFSARRVYLALRQSAQARYVADWLLALAAGAVEDREAVAHHLHRAWKEREPSLIFMHEMPLFEATAVRASVLDAG